MTPLVREFASIGAALALGDAVEFQWFDITDSVNNFVKKATDIRSVVDCNMPFEKVIIVGQTGTTKTMVLATGKNFEEGITVAGFKISGMVAEDIPVCVYKIQDGKMVFLTKEMLDYEAARRQGKDVPYFEPRPLSEPITRCASYLAELLRALRHESVTGYIPVEKKGFISAKRKAKGKPPLYDWTTVVVEPRLPRSEHQGGTHASPRQHDRRGHLRRMRSGKEVWVRACKVGNAANGTVFHDYQVRSVA